MWNAKIYIQKNSWKFKPNSCNKNFSNLEAKPMKSQHKIKQKDNRK